MKYRYVRLVVLECHALLVYYGLAARGAPMIIATLIGLLALFSILSILLGSDDPEDPRAYRKDEFPFWLRYGHR
jgi:hypothetical protein